MAENLRCLNSRGIKRDELVRFGTGSICAGCSRPLAAGLINECRAPKLPFARTKSTRQACGGAHARETCGRVMSRLRRES